MDNVFNVVKCSQQVLCCYIKYRTIADDDLSFDTSYASVFTIEYTLNRVCLLKADAMAYVICA